MKNILCFLTLLSFASLINTFNDTSANDHRIDPTTYIIVNLLKPQFEFWKNILTMIFSEIYNNSKTKIIEILCYIKKSLHSKDMSMKLLLKNLPVTEKN